ncbi:MAG: cytochrome B, partial [Marivivens sp.]|nr:cytochrome B [Marivivens sp.]
MKNVKVWDPLIRIFHWSLVICFISNALITDPESQLHRQIGYVVAGLVAFRIIWGFVGSRHARFRDFPPSISGSVGQLSDMATGRKRIHVGHTPLGALMIYNLIVTLIGIAITG